MNPAPNLTNEFLDWPFVATVFVTWALVELARVAHAWVKESRALDRDMAVLDEQAQRAAESGRWAS